VFATKGLWPVKNFETKCHGLSPGLFIFGIMGNSTYALSICVSSMEMDHLIANASWLAGKMSPVFRTQSLTGGGG
jgi:solute carrier family 66 (lysosomal lysine-arginine transporter), member 1